MIRTTFGDVWSDMMIQLVQITVAFAIASGAVPAGTKSSEEPRGEQGARALIKEFGLEWPKNPVSYHELPEQARRAISQSFDRTLEGRTVIIVEDGQEEKVRLGDFATETGDGSELSCEFGGGAIGCWHENGNFTGCYAVGEDGDYECVWNEPIGGSDD